MPQVNMRASGGLAHPLERDRERLVAEARVQRAGHRDRAGVDQWIEGRVRPGLQLDRVERVAARLDVDVLERRVVAERLDRDAEHQRLGHRLHRERLARVADLEHAPLGRHHADAEVGQVGLRELGDAGGDLALVEARVARMEPLEEALDAVDFLGRTRHAGIGAWGGLGARASWRPRRIERGLQQACRRRIGVRRRRADPPPGPPRRDRRTRTALPGTAVMREAPCGMHADRALPPRARAGATIAPAHRRDGDER
jgi:hypothetical protein